MNRILTVSQIQRLEKMAIDTIGLPSVVLMDNAGRAVAQSVLNAFSQARGLRIKVICGTGNNGGDGFVAARYLWEAGVKVDVLLCGAEQDLKNAPQMFYRANKNLKIPIRLFSAINAAFVQQIKGADGVVDALFGIGLNRPLEGFYLDAVKAMNNSHKNIWAVDIPTGLDGSTGKVWGDCIRASTTVSFSCSKKGFLVNEGLQSTGQVQVVNIGIPDQLIRKFGVPCR